MMRNIAAMPGEKLSGKVISIFIIFLHVLIWWGPAFAEPPIAALEYKVKAAYIFKFLPFIKWPGKLPSRNSDKITIGVIGKSPIYEALVSQQHMYKDAEIEILRLKTLQKIDSLDILFITGSTQKSLEDLFLTIKGHAILTVGEAKNFSQKGGIIKFTLLRGKVKFEVNRKAARDARLEISARMLKAAVKVLE